MATYGPDDIAVRFDATDGGALQSMTQHVTEIDVLDIEAMFDQNTRSYGDVWSDQAYIGVRRWNPITLRGVYDDTATTGPNATFNSVGSQRTLELTWGGSKTTTVETLILNYRRIPQIDGMTRYEVVLQPIGAPTEV